MKCPKCDHEGYDFIYWGRETLAQGINYEYRQCPRCKELIEIDIIKKKQEEIKKLKGICQAIKENRELGDIEMAYKLWKEAQELLEDAIGEEEEVKFLTEIASEARGWRREIKRRKVAAERGG